MSPTLPRTDRLPVAVLAALALVVGFGLIGLTIGDGVVTGERGPRVGAFVDGNLITGVMFLLGGLLGGTAAARSDRRPATLGGLLLATGALAHLVGIAAGVDLLGGSGSTVAAFVGLGGGLLAVGRTPTSGSATEVASADDHDITEEAT